MRLGHLKLMPIVLILLLIFLQYRLWFDSDGIQHMYILKKQLSLQTEENVKLKKRNEELLSEIRLLQANQTAIEAHARQELGMIKKDETFYQVIN